MKMRDLNRMKVNLSLLGKSLYATYSSQIDHLKNGRALPQLAFNTVDLLKASCYITSDSDNYIFLFPRVYCPQYVTKDNVRYELSKEDKEAIKRDIFIEFQITRDKKLFKPIILNIQGHKFEHYHGRNGDCWGKFFLPETWDGRLLTLTGMVYQIMGALAVINFNSLMQHQPPTMPKVENMMTRATKLGVEGIIGEGQPQDTAINAPRRGWGRLPPAQPPILTDEQEMMRRFGMEHPIEEYLNMPLCALCGLPYGRHGGWRCPEVRDAR